MTAILASPTVEKLAKVPPVCWERIVCNLCERDETELYHRERLAYFGRPVEFAIVRCRNCGLVYTNPRLLEHNATYEQGGIDEEGVFEAHARHKAQIFSAAMPRLGRLLTSEAHRWGPKLLDVGCGSGHFLVEAHRAGWHVTGLEPAKGPAEYAAHQFGLEIVQKGVLEAEFGLDSFDAITLWDVLEHVGDPQAVLRRCAGWLRRGGVLVCRFPSARWQKFKAGVFERLGWERPVFSPTMHHYFFDAGPFARLAEQSGLSVVKIRTTAMEPNTDSGILNLAKRIIGPFLQAAGMAGLQWGNLEAYCRKG
jgi:2-polyprenyl-3-methyl-5-hydroxy-6-metoxy-1,4-benzoquinol methylase